MGNVKIFTFDFDGVILDSAGIKAVAFGEMFDRFPLYAEQMKAYSHRNSGYSRYIQFRHFYVDIMGLEYDAETERRVVEEFADKVLEKVLAASFIDGAVEFVQVCKAAGHKTYIVTGTPQEDILYITEKRGIKDAFDGIYGSPEIKEDILSRIMRENGVEGEELVFFGDAMSDYDAAKACGVRFVGVGKETAFPKGTICINNFAGKEVFDLFR